MCKRAHLTTPAAVSHEMSAHSHGLVSRPAGSQNEFTRSGVTCNTSSAHATAVADRRNSPPTRSPWAATAEVSSGQHKKVTHGPRRFVVVGHMATTSER